MGSVFFGTPLFAVPTLTALIESGENLVCVVTQPDRAKGRGHVLSPPPVKEIALARGIEVLQPQKIRDAGFVGRLQELDPEFIIVVAYGKILPPEVLQIPRRGCINVHGSLLPLYRGAAPIQWAILNGDEVTGITTMMMDEGLDTGDILLQSPMEIRDDDTAQTLGERLAALGANLLIETLKGLREGRITPRRQEGQASNAPPLKKQDGRIDWHRDARDLALFVRGMSPWPSAFCYLSGERVRIRNARYAEGGGVPGRVERAGAGELLIGTGKGLLAVREIQPEGRKVMTAGAFLAGRRLRERHDTFS